MKRALLATMAAVVLVSTSTGCCLIDRIFACRKCGAYGGYPCGGGGCSTCGSAYGGYAGGPGGGGDLAYGGCATGQCDPGNAVAGPPSPSVTYPYYTTRGPRDYLARSPRPIGP